MKLVSIRQKQNQPTYLDCTDMYWLRDENLKSLLAKERLQQKHALIIFRQSYVDVYRWHT